MKVLESIENFGSMNVLCSDKTGTLTEGTVRLHSASDINGTESDKIFLYAFLNASLESGFANPIDVAIRNEKRNVDISTFRKIDEVPYDFIRKRLSILASHTSENILITKGSFSNILEVCDKAEMADGSIVSLNEIKNNLIARFQQLSIEGFRVLGLAYKNMSSVNVIHKDVENAMTFLGFIVFNDPPKEEIGHRVKDYYRR